MTHVDAGSVPALAGHGKLARQGKRELKQLVAVCCIQILGSVVGILFLLIDLFFHNFLLLVIDLFHLHDIVRYNRLVVGLLQVDTVVEDLLIVQRLVCPEEDSVCPGGSSLLLRCIVEVRADVELIAGQKVNFSLLIILQNGLCLPAHV